ncbi:MAG: terminase gpA endonuclease subunit [Bryobacteraceae bacterium]
MWRWRSLDELLAQPWPHERGITLPVLACCIDSGFHTTSSRGAPVREWRRKKEKRRRTRETPGRPTRFRFPTTALESYQPLAHEQRRPHSRNVPDFHVTGSPKGRRSAGRFHIPKGPSLYGRAGEVISTTTGSGGSDMRSHPHTYGSF